MCIRVIGTTPRDELYPTFKILTHHLDVGILCSLEFDLRTGARTMATLRTPFTCQKPSHSLRLIRITISLSSALTLRFEVLQMLKCIYELSEVIIEADGTSPFYKLQYQEETSEHNRLGFVTLVSNSSIIPAVGEMLTAPYATAILLKSTGVLHQVAVVKTKTMTKQPIRPSQAITGCRPPRIVDA